MDSSHVTVPLLTYLPISDSDSLLVRVSRVTQSINSDRLIAVIIVGNSETVIDNVIASL